MHLLPDNSRVHYWFDLPATHPVCDSVHNSVPRRNADLQGGKPAARGWGSPYRHIIAICGFNFLVPTPDNRSRRKERWVVRTVPDSSNHCLRRSPDGSPSRLHVIILCLNRDSSVQQNTWTPRHSDTKISRTRQFETQTVRTAESDTASNVGIVHDI